MAQMTFKPSGLPRFTVTACAGARDGKGFAVVDRHGNQRVSWHKTAAQAMKAAQALNRKEKQS